MGRHRAGSVIKTIDQFNWNQPTKINLLQAQDFFHLDSVAKQVNVVFISSVGLGKSHLIKALGYAAAGADTRYCSPTVKEIVTTLAAADAAGGFKTALAASVKPEVLCIAKLG